MLHSGASTRLRFLKFITVCKAHSHILFPLFLTIGTEEEPGQIALYLLYKWRTESLRWGQVAAQVPARVAGLVFNPALGPAVDPGVCVLTRNMSWGILLMRLILEFIYDPLIVSFQVKCYCFWAWLDKVQSTELEKVGRGKGRGGERMLELPSLSTLLLGETPAQELWAALSKLIIHGAGWMALTFSPTSHYSVLYGKYNWVCIFIQLGLENGNSESLERTSSNPTHIYCFM